LLLTVCETSTFLSEIESCRAKLQVVIFLSPLRGLVSPEVLPTAHAVGCILAPLRG
jgi:hypothetical protein